MIPSSFLQFPIAWSLSLWRAALGEYEPSRSSEATVYTICPSLCYTADKFITCQFSSVWLCLDRSNPCISVTIGVAITSSALILSPSIPAELHPILGSAYFALASAMACRVFRAVLLGIIKDPQVDIARISSVVRSTTNNQHDGGDVLTSKYDKSGGSSKLKINVEVEMDRRADSYDGYTFWDRSSTGDDVRHDASRLV